MGGWSCWIAVQQVTHWASWGIMISQVVGSYCCGHLLSLMCSIYILYGGGESLAVDGRFPYEFLGFGPTDMATSPMNS